MDRLNEELEAGFSDTESTTNDHMMSEKVLSDIQILCGVIMI